MLLVQCGQLQQLQRNNLGCFERWLTMRLCQSLQINEGAGSQSPLQGHAGLQ